MNHICPLCCYNADHYGKPAYHTVNSVAGIPSLDYISQSYSLAKCSKCNLVFKSSFPNKEVFNQLYSQSGKVNVNNTQSLPIDGKAVVVRRFDQIESIARDFSQGNRILDIGCNDGTMLYSWSNNWDKYGLEYSDACTKVAINRELKIIGKTVDDCQDEFNSYFDVVTLIDVAEHIPNPKDFFKDLFALLKPGGIIVIFTGTTDYWFWKLIKSGYWYESFPEHIIFWSKKTFEFLAELNNSSVIYYKQISHYNDNNQINYFTQLIKNLAFWIVKSLSSNLFLNENFLKRGYPSFTSAPDHILFVIKKN